MAGLGFNLTMGLTGTAKAAPATLGTLGVNPPTITENSAPGAIVGAITGGKPGSTITITGTAGSRFDISVGNIVAGVTNTDYETATSYDITLRETNAAYPNSPKDTVIAIQVADVNTVLQPLSLSAATIAENSAAGMVVGAIQGANGGTVTITDTAGGRFAISGGNVVAGSTGTDYETATTHNITLTETLGESSNSPRNTVLAIAVTDVAVEIVAAWNPADKNSEITLSNANLTATKAPGAAEGFVRGTTSKSSGKWHFEVTCQTPGTARDGVGIATSGASVDSGLLLANPGGAYQVNGYVGAFATPAGFGNGTYGNGDVIAVEVDLDNLQLYFQKSGGSRIGPFTIGSGAFFPAVTFDTTGAAFVGNFGASAFTITPTSGFSAWA